MPRFRSRIARIRRFARVIYGLVIGSVVLVTALSYWRDRLGPVGVAVVGGIVLATLACVVALSDRAWAREWAQTR